MKVLVVYHYAYAPSVFGGNRHWMSAASLMKRHSVEILVLASSFFHKRLTSGESSLGRSKQTSRFGMPPIASWRRRLERI